MGLVVQNRFVVDRRCRERRGGRPVVPVLFQQAHARGVHEANSCCVRIDGVSDDAPFAARRRGQCAHFRPSQALVLAARAAFVTLTLTLDKGPHKIALASMASDTPVHRPSLSISRVGARRVFASPSLFPVHSALLSAFHQSASLATHPGLCASRHSFVKYIAATAFCGTAR